MIEMAAVFYLLSLKMFWKIISLLADANIQPGKELIPLKTFYGFILFS